MYRLLNGNNESYYSENKGLLGGNKALKIYGRLDCPSALYWIKKGYYVNNRVFFATEDDAIKAGYRPCGKCMPEEYAKWKAKENTMKLERKR